jgi:hypothetical protein
MTFAAINDFCFQARKSIRERLHIRIALPQQEQHQPQGCSASYARQRRHLVHCLL